MSASQAPRSWSAQRSTLQRAFVVVLGPTVLALAWLWFQERLDLAVLMRDPAATRDLPLHTGLISNVGVLVWFAGAVICLFTAHVLRRTALPLSAYLFASGVLTLVLALDDFLMIHEFLSWALAIPEYTIVGTYAVLTSCWLIAFKRIISQTDHLLLLLALTFFALSLVPDTAAVRALGEERLMRLLEDGGKLLGIVTWTSYFAVTSTRAIHAASADAPASRPRVQDLAS